MVTESNSPKVSIIIPVYNVKPYVAEALDSVINQTYKNLEIIVIDDGSNDGSEKICDEYAKKDNRIKLIHQENRGLSAARNTGLDNMSGEYVAFLDSDDVFELEAIEKSLQAMLYNNVDCVVFKRIDCKTKRNGKLKQLSKDTIVPKMSEGIYSRQEALRLIANRKINFAVWNKLYKSYIWKNLRFPDGIVYEDVYLILQIIDKTKNIYMFDDILIKHRIREGSIVLTPSFKNIKDNFNSWSVFYRFIESHTPDIFDIEQVIKTRKKKFGSIVLDYAKILSLNFSEKDKVLNLIKEIIKSYEKVLNIKDCSLEIRLVYYLIYNHPKITSIFFLPCFYLYKYIRSIVKNFV